MRLALVQAKRGALGVGASGHLGQEKRSWRYLFELFPLLVEEATCTRTVFSTLVDELARQGHFLVRHNKGLRCKVCNVYRAHRQFRFWSRHPCVPRPSAAVVISQFRNKKRQLINMSAGNSCHVLGQPGERSKTSSKHDEKELYHCTSLGGQDIQCTHSHPEHLPLPVSLEPEVDLTHSHQCCDHSISQAAEQSGESQHVLTKLHDCGMEGKRRKIASFADRGGPRAPLRSNFDDPEGRDTSGSEEECAQRDVVHRMAPVAGRPIIMCGTSGCSGLVRCLQWKMGTKLGRSQLHVRTCGRIFPRPNISGIKSRIPLLPGLKSQVCCLGAKRCVNSLGVKWKQYCRPLWAQRAGAVFLWFRCYKEHTVISGLSAGSFAPVQSISRADCVEAEWSWCHVPRATYISTPSKPVFFSSV